MERSNSKCEEWCTCWSLNAIESVKNIDHAPFLKLTLAAPLTHSSGWLPSSPEFDPYQTGISESVKAIKYIWRNHWKYVYFWLQWGALCIRWWAFWLPCSSSPTLSHVRVGFLERRGCLWDMHWILKVLIPCLHYFKSFNWPGKWVKSRTFPHSHSNIYTFIQNGG